MEISDAARALGEDAVELYLEVLDMLGTSSLPLENSSFFEKNVEMIAEYGSKLFRKYCEMVMTCQTKAPYLSPGILTGTQDVASGRRSLEKFIDVFDKHLEEIDRIHKTMDYELSQVFEWGVAEIVKCGGPVEEYLEFVRKFSGAKDLDLFIRCASEPTNGKGIMKALKILDENFEEINHFVERINAPTVKYRFVQGAVKIAKLADDMLLKKFFKTAEKINNAKILNYFAVGVGDFSSGGEVEEYLRVFDNNSERMSAFFESIKNLENKDYITRGVVGAVKRGEKLLDGYLEVATLLEDGLQEKALVGLTKIIEYERTKTDEILAGRHKGMTMTSYVLYEHGYPIEAIERVMKGLEMYDLDKYDIPTMISIALTALGGGKYDTAR